METTFVSCVTAITALIATVINLLSGLSSIKKSKEAKREDDYYNHILRPYIKLYHEDAETKNVIDFLKEKDINKPFIPPYVRYVYYNKSETKENRSEQLDKLLIIDYVKLYENEDRAVDRFFKVTDRVGKVLSIIGLIFFLILSGLICIALTDAILVEMLAEDKQIQKIIAGTLTVMFFIGLNILALIITIRTVTKDTDMYSTKQKKINKQIRELDITFDRIKKNHYF